MVLRRHPTKRLLLEWLNGAEGSERLDPHLDTCEICAAKLMDLESVESGPWLKEALGEVLAPPEDLTDRLEDGVKTRLASRVVFGVLADFYATGWETSKMLLIEGEE